MTEINWDHQEFLLAFDQAWEEQAMKLSGYRRGKYMMAGLIYEQVDGQAARAEAKY